MTTPNVLVRLSSAVGFVVRSLYGDSSGQNPEQSPQLAVVEPLTPRRLLSASVVNGVLVVTSPGASGETVSVYEEVSSPTNNIVVEDSGGTYGPFAVNTFSLIRINGSTSAETIEVASHDNYFPPSGKTYVSKPCEIHGDAGNDTIYGGDLSDNITGDLGSDQIRGGRGNDLLNGGYGYGPPPTDGGNDFVYGDEGADTLYGSNGDDYLEDFDTTDYGVFDGGDGDDTIWAGDKDDTLFGGAGNDELHGGDGNDELHGGDDNDVLTADRGDDHVFGDAGDDTFNDGDGYPDTLDGGSGDDTLASTDGSNTISNIEHA